MANFRIIATQVMALPCLTPQMVPDSPLPHTMDTLCLIRYAILRKKTNTTKRKGRANTAKAV